MLRLVLVAAGACRGGGVRAGTRHTRGSVGTAREEKSQTCLPVSRLSGRSWRAENDGCSSASSIPRRLLSKPATSPRAAALRGPAYAMLFGERAAFNALAIASTKRYWLIDSAEAATRRPSLRGRSRPPLRVSL